MDKTTLKTIAVFIIIFGCFAVLYPKLFHPVISSFFTTRDRSAASDDYEPRSAKYTKKDRRSVNDHFSPPHMKVGGHPGLHAFSEMKKYAGQKQGSGGRGVLGVVLPLYAAGILIYLIYTLTKLFLRKRSDGVKGGLSLNDDPISYTDAKDISEASMKEKVIKKQKELERLLWKADQEDIGDEDINLLKKRLIETENQMTRILEAMENIQRTVSSSSNFHNYSQNNLASECDGTDEKDQVRFPNDNEVDEPEGIGVHDGGGEVEERDDNEFDEEEEGGEVLSCGIAESPVESSTLRKRANIVQVETQ